MSTICPICLAQDSRRLFTVDGYDIHVCRACTGGFAEPRGRMIDVGEIYDSAYFEEYHASPMEGPEFAAFRYHRIRRQVDSLLRSNAEELPLRVLDIGCASGYFLSLFDRDGWECTGVEVSEAAIQFSRSQLGLRILEGDFLEVSLSESRFDLITMFHVIEHFREPRTAVTKALDLLDEGGILFVETPNWNGIGALLMGPRWSHYIPPEHLNYFGPRSLRRMLREQGFNDVSIATYTPPILEGVGKLPRALRGFAHTAYNVSALVGLGASLQAMAIHPLGP